MAIYLKHSAVVSACATHISDTGQGMQYTEGAILLLNFTRFPRPSIYLVKYDLKSMRSVPDR
jgi:hypothetical protein